MQVGRKLTSVARSHRLLSPFVRLVECSLSLPSELCVVPLRNLDVAMTESLTQQLDAVASLQEVRSKRVPKVMGRMLDARLLEGIVLPCLRKDLPIWLLEVRGRILRQSVTGPKEVFRVPVRSSLCSITASTMPSPASSCKRIHALTRTRFSGVISTSSTAFMTFARYLFRIMWPSDTSSLFLSSAKLLHSAIGFVAKYAPYFRLSSN
jgi:hypothetical protein